MIGVFCVYDQTSVNTKKIDINCVHMRALVELDCVISDAIIFYGAVDNWSTEFL